MELAWTFSAAFGATDGRTTVHQMVAYDGGFVAVGVESANPVAPEHHEGRVWVSADGRNWAEVTPPDLVADTSLTSVFVAGDGTLIALGTRYGWDDNGRYLPSAALAWESRDGRDWQSTATGLPDLVLAPRIVSGALGHVALIGEADYAAGGLCPTMYCGFELWYSPDGRRWEQSHSLAVDIPRVVIDAGDEGFVVAGIAGAAGQSYVFATGDGRRWFESAAPPPAIAWLAAIGGDWLILTGDTPTGGAQPATVWHSANGLDWRQVGDLPLSSLATGAGDCRERVGSLLSAGVWLIASTGLDHPCVDVHRNASLPGRPRLSLDGTSWATLALPVGSETDDAVRVSAALASGDLLLIAGTSDGQATFWRGEP